MERHTMSENLTPSRIRTRRQAAKERRRAERAERSAAIDATWMAHMWQETPGERAETAAKRPGDVRPDADRGSPVNVPHKRSEAVPEWPADLPRPNPGYRYPSISALVKWLGIENRRFDRAEVAEMTSAWATVATEAGVFSWRKDRPSTRAELPHRPDARPGRVMSFGTRT